MNLSIIIPALNEEKNLEQLLPFLKDNISRSDEILVCDGESSDNSRSIAKEKRAVLISCDKASRASQMNLGARAATNEILLFLHADVRPPKNFKSQILDAINSGIDLGRFQSKFDHTGTKISVNEWATKFDFIICNGGDQGLFIKKSHFEKIGGYNEDYVIMEDYEILERARIGAKYQVLNDRVLVSTRKYINNSYLRVNLSNLLIFALYLLGSSPSYLRKLYSNLIRKPR